jgi:5-methylcytosine-specific restriction endonuclease McrA
MADDPPAVTEDFFIPADDEHVSREKEKARELRKSQWWKNVRGRGRCHYCNAAVPPRELTMDHVVPIIRGGRTTRGNVVACCKTCNNEKSHLLPIEWAAYLARLAGADGGDR